MSTIIFLLTLVLVLNCLLLVLLILAQLPKKESGSGLAFGGGALLFALSIELFGHVLHRAGDGHGHITQPKLVFAAIIAGSGVLGNYYAELPALQDQYVNDPNYAGRYEIVSSKPAVGWTLIGVGSALGVASGLFFAKVFE